MVMPLLLAGSFLGLRFHVQETCSRGRWHLSKNPSKCKTREYLADAGPANPKAFIFSPEVGKTLNHPVQAPEVEKIQRFGRGSLTIEKFKLLPAANGCPVIEWMQFSVRLEGGY